LPQEYFSVAVLFYDSVFHTTNPYPAGVSDGKGLSKDDQVKAPKDFKKSLWSLFYLPFYSLAKTRKEECLMRTVAIIGAIAKIQGVKKLRYQNYLCNHVCPG